MSRKKSYFTTFLGVPQRIKQIRGDLRQIEFAKILGVTQSTINKYEKGDILPSEDIQKKIVNYGGVTVEWLLHGDAPEPPAAKIKELAPEIYDAGPLTPMSETALTEVIAAVEDYYARHRLKRRPIQKARLIIKLYQHYAETREKPDDILIKGNLPLAD